MKDVKVDIAKNWNQLLIEFDGYRLLNQSEIEIGKSIFIKGDDGKLYKLTIVHDDGYQDENNELCETEAYYYQSKGELYTII